MKIEEAVKNIELVLDKQVQGLNGEQFKAVYLSWEIIKNELKEKENNDS